MATYNGEKWITEQLNSIKNQTIDNISSIIISDDNSTDKTIEKINFFKKENDISIEFLNSRSPILSSRGHANNFFKLILYSSIKNDTKWIAFSDQDDIWFPDKLQRAINFLEENPKYGGWSSSVTAFWDDKEDLHPKAWIYSLLQSFFLNQLGRDVLMF